MKQNNIQMLNDEVSTIPQSMFRAKKKKIITIFHLKIIIFTAVKNRSISHGCVFLMCFTACRMIDYSLRNSFSPFIVSEMKIFEYPLKIHPIYCFGNQSNLAIWTKIIPHI